MKIVSGSSDPQLAANIAKQLQTTVIPCKIAKFANGEKKITVSEEARDEKILLVQSFSQPVDEHIIETLLIADALERLGVESIELFVPWFGYSFQDKVFSPGQPLSAKVIAETLSNTSISKVYLLDLHNINIPGFFATPTDHLTALPIFTKYIQDNYQLTDALVVSPDFGGVKRAQEFADQLGLDIEVVEKRRDLKTGEIASMKLDGEITGKTIFIFDDAILSGGTTIKVTELLKEKGAKAVHFFATHGVFTNDALDKLGKSAIDSVVITNSITQADKNEKIVILDVAPAVVAKLTKEA